jgi:hypothetical protein
MLFPQLPMPTAMVYVMATINSNVPAQEIANIAHHADDALHNGASR